MISPIKLNKIRTTLCAVLFVGLATFAFAQSEETTEAAPEVASSNSLFTKVKQGGWAMYPLGILSMSAFALTIYNFIALRKKDFFDDVVASELGQKLNQLDIAGAAALCEEHSAPLTRIVNHGLDSIKGGHIDTELFRQRLEAGSSKELAKPFVVINYLSIIASIAPMVGLLGTVSGMVKAFDSIATVGMGQPEVLAGNISEALITTASGMLVGIPAMFFFFYFKNQYGNLVADMTMYLDDMHGDLVHGTRSKSESGSTSPSATIPQAPRNPRA
ncbi:MULTISPECIES: MotA/TolQ/ExbB proton channel family protein [unclassified Lentimonas]|uniref:MotA/TolQ/ExbB proton channel family protein n=1 Tax=unclassified Lentimonas TaxID=2630993 RepID=UPI0013212612|nr:MULTISPECIES: MotA/TolQ/ExbB proton channel family protein [unclassified Lentimonas]CAA6691624.1 MotA/TolQ/ExbB proton channel family protein [Lentimonas sp. CC19]CAA6692243.1 MotA/TolQ/ExbB proton channel family protein [Lentimonas sp. CC10]CAA7070185.1 MotA/TolQ/ExbB proton channel family protein [Lentimonas sp. CC11]